MSVQYLSSKSSWLTGLIALLLVVALPGCDSGGGGGGETIVLSDPLNPTEASFEFTYTEDQLSNGEITVASEEQDGLSQVISAYGFRRSDVVSARVEEVKLERISAPNPSSTQLVTKVFNYLSKVDVYLGTSTEAPLIGTRQPIPSDQEVTLDLGPDRDVTNQVKSGPTKALLRLSISDPDQIGSGGDRVEVEIRFRIEVQQ